MTDHFTSYEDLDEMFVDIKRREDEANKSVTTAQKQVEWGDCWWSYRPDFDNVFIFGECWTMEQNEKGERGAGADSEEWLWTRNRLIDSHDRGYRFGMAYSIIVPEGELGSTHISQMISRLSREQFEWAKSQSWYVGADCEEALHMNNIALATAKHASCMAHALSRCACPHHTPRTLPNGGQG